MGLIVCMRGMKKARETVMNVWAIRKMMKNAMNEQECTCARVFICERSEGVFELPEFIAHLLPIFALSNLFISFSFLPIFHVPAPIPALLYCNDQRASYQVRDETQHRHLTLW